MSPFHAVSPDVDSTRQLRTVYDLPEDKSTTSDNGVHVKKREIVCIYAAVVVVLIITCLISPLVGVITAAIVPAAHDAWLFLA
jgi:Flp pilus assembly protein TadB